MKIWIDTAATERAETLFGVPPIERLRRSAAKLVAGTPVVLSGPDVKPQAWPGARLDADNTKLGSRLRKALAEGPLVALDGANVIDPRLIAFLVRRAGSCAAARGEGAQRAVALRLEPELADAIPPDADNLSAVADALIAAGRIGLLDEQEFPAYMDKLRRSLPYWIHAVNDAATRRRLERQMFWDNYKGSTDLLTRYVYPPLVWPLVRLCVRLGLHPNTVTLLSIVLTIAAVPLFARGDFLLGFVCAYGMSVLDSVDGKLARLTLTDSKIGNVLDHGTDIVHPPFWYFAFVWGLGAHSADDPLYQAAIWMIVFYVADRIVLSIAKRRIGFALHAATRLDGIVRSFIARRNITMTIMAVSILLGVGAAGFYIITAWQGLTFAWHSARTIWLGFISRTQARPVA
ncbi:MAG: CDP-alcohol phosphatidyltransferase family protein [Burkholderiaceae bacterium]|nr:CDP-alcohol phosphatidyltransferase family protein [Burkholderiaceae bacterium]